MQLKPRILAALGLALAPLAAIAQDVELITQASVDFEIAFTTNITTQIGAGTSRQDTTRSIISTIRNAEIIRGLANRGVIVDAGNTDLTGWSLRAVRPAPADAVWADTKFFLYAIKTETNGTVSQRVLVPSNIFQINAVYSTTNSVTTHSTRSVISSSGTSTNFAELDFTPSFVRTPPAVLVAGSPFTVVEDGTTLRFNRSRATTSAFTLDALSTSGFTSITFQSRSDPVFYIAILGMTYTAKGDFSGTFLNTITDTRKFISPRRPDAVESTTTDTVPTPGSGLVSVRIKVFPAALVERALYPDVSFEDNQF